jgi:hypothetical protein
MLKYKIQIQLSMLNLHEYEVFMCCVCVVSPPYLAATWIRCIKTEININTVHFVRANGRHKT